jgi:hypothetical protein
VPRTPLRQNWSKAMRRTSSWSNSRGLKLCSRQAYLTRCQKHGFLTPRQKQTGTYAALRQ